jgi:glycosyltransferase involved in cell wall biosynthesis
VTKALQVMAGAAVGGAEEFFMRLVPALARAGVEQRVALRTHDTREAIFKSAGIQTVAAKFGGMLDFSTRGIVRQEAADFTPDIVMAWMSRAAHYCPAGNHVLAARLGGYYNMKYYRHCDHLIGNTETIRSYLIAQGWPEERAWYIPNFVDGAHADAIDRSNHDTPNDAPLLLALGRLHENKAFDVLIAALANIPNAYLWIAGDGPQDSALRAATHTYGVADRVRFHGWRNDIPKLLATADLLVCPSRHEPLGNVVIEGWAHGVPVVAANSDGPRSLIRNEETGLLVPINDADTLSRSINRLIGSPDFAAELASAGYRAYQATYTENIVVQQYQAFFEKVVP